jgi:hypothetical protein
VLGLVAAPLDSGDDSDIPSYTRLNSDLLVKLMVEVVSVPGWVAVGAQVADVEEAEAEAAAACRPFDDIQVHQNHEMAHNVVGRRYCVDSLPDKVREEIEVCSGHWPSRQHASGCSRKDSAGE